MNIDSSIIDEFTQITDACRKNRVFPECSFISKLISELPKIEKLIEQGTQFYRARVYKNDLSDYFFDSVKRMKDDIEHAEDYLQGFAKEMVRRKALEEAGFKGFDAKGSFVCPDVRLISAGRCNYENEQCLYVAEDVQTAISEIKPLIRESISVACIQVEEPLRIVDFGFELSENQIIKLIAFLFVSSPTLDDYDAYMYTQIICALVRKLGYDGVKYSSCQSPSRSNYAIFNFEKCRAIASEVYEVETIDYHFKKK